MSENTSGERWVGGPAHGETDGLTRSLKLCRFGHGPEVVTVKARTVRPYAQQRPKNIQEID